MTTQEDISADFPFKSNYIEVHGFESYRVSRRPHFLGGWGLWDVQVGFLRRCASVPFGWSRSTGRPTHQRGRCCSRWHRSSAARRRRCGSGCGRRSVMWASAGPDDERAGAVAGAGARGPRTEASERDPAEGVRIFRPGGARPPGEVATMVQFIDDHRDVFGVEPICAVLPIAPSTDSSPSAPADPSDAPVRAGAARRSAPRRDSAGL